MTKSERNHMNRVAELGCLACRQLGYHDTPAELHHPRSGAGMSQRASSLDVIGLCPAHHRGTHHPLTPSIHLDRRAFEAAFGTEAALLQRVRDLLDGRAS